MGLMFLGQFLGPVLGPPIGGVLAQAFGWQWTFWFMAIAAAAVWLQLFYIVPETYREEPKDALAELDEKEQQQIVEKQHEGESKTKFPNPLLPIMLLRFPVIFLASLEVGMIFGLMFSSKLEAIIFGIYLSILALVIGRFHPFLALFVNLWSLTTSFAFFYVLGVFFFCFFNVF